MTTGRHTLASINELDPDEAVTVFGGVFEHSPWIVRESWASRPFDSLTALHAALCRTVRTSSPDRHLALIRAHPDLVGMAAQAGTLTRESTGEQRAAGIAADDLGPEEIAAFAELNARYQEKFGFPFVICARDNRKTSILAGFRNRLPNSPETERIAAIREIERIAWYRLADLVEPEN